MKLTHQSNLKYVMNVAKRALIRSERDELNYKDIEQMYKAITKLIQAMEKDGYIINTKTNH